MDWAGDWWKTFFFEKLYFRMWKWENFISLPTVNWNIPARVVSRTTKTNNESGKLCCFISFPSRALKIVNEWRKKEEKLSSRSRLKTNYLNDNEKLMATRRNVSCLILFPCHFNIEEINWVIFWCFRLILLCKTQSHFFPSFCVHMQNSRRTGKFIWL